MTSTTLLLQFLLALILAPLTKSQTPTGHLLTTSADDLLKRLMSQYNSAVRPVSSNSSSSQLTTDVEFLAHLIRIHELNAKEQILHATFWINLRWNDTRLAWDPTEFSGYEKITLPSSLIWTPDIYLYNNLDASEGFIRSNVQVSVNYKGHVTYLLPITAKTTCSMDAKYFPFDEQLCALKFGSWAHTAEQINLIASPSELELGWYTLSSVWMLSGARVVKNLQFYVDSDAPTVDITSTLYLRRVPGVSVLYTIIPYLVILFLAVLVSCLSPDRAEKIILQTILILVTILQQIYVISQLPDTFTAPFVVQYGSLIILLLCASTATTILLYKIQSCGETGSPVPDLLRLWILDRLARVLWCGYCCKNKGESVELSVQSDERKKIGDDANPQSDGQEESKSGHPEGRQKFEWKNLSLVLDRLVFIIFFVFAMIIFLLFVVNLVYRKRAEVHVPHV